MKRLRGKKGFTLVEMVVTLTIVGILLAGSVMGVGAYIDYSNFRSNNDCAYSLFMTIQSALAQQKASGELERIKNTYVFTSIPLPDSGGEKTGRSVQYIIIANGDLATPNGKAFLDIVGDYIYDKSLLNASILVELDLTEGTVYSVAYSKQAEGLSYDSDNTSDQSGKVSIKFGNRERSIRRGTLLGYYSSELPDSAPSSLGRPSISYVMLKNGETLDLGWRMNGRYRGQLSSLLTYDITLKAASGDTAAFTLNENGSAIAAGSGNYNVKVTHNGSEQTVTLPFTVAVEADGIHVTLDMADIEAARQAELTAPGIPSYDKTESAMRLSALWGGYTGGISATVQARGITTAVSDAKTSATENLFLGTGNTIQNARHLFNLRFMGDTPSTFKQTASFAWGGTDGLLAHGKVANSRAMVTDRDTAFPSIAALAEGSTLEGAQNLKMDYLRFSDGGESENGVALLRENYGTIKNVTFSNATVEAEHSDFVAAACGVNYGSLIGVSVEGNVTGRNYVGGVAGYDGSATVNATNDEILRSSLKNAAAVTGESYVGGIFGATVRPKGEAGESGILSCTNTGAIRSSKDEGRFIGGIAGLNSGRTIKECTSTPKGKLSDAKAADLKGDYVGGIVGLQTSGGIKNCNTNGGLVAGGNFVGGIVGLSTAGDLDGEGGHNRADVAGKKYVGGITGANVKAAVTLTTEQKTITGATVEKPFTAATVEKSGVTETDGVVTGWEEYDSENTVSNWTNEGIVTANGSYAGGITGFNAGKIAECSANVNVSTTSGKNRLDALTALADANKLGSLADFVGGIAGANVNEIAAPAGNARFVCVAAGRDYVGGIVGYNAAGGSVTGFAVSDAYISGRCFVGGFMGLNCAAGVYGTGNNNINTIEAHPSLIEGEYFVGGIMGGSIIASDKLVTLHCTVNNFQGNITSETGAAVGGLIGYNAMLKESSEENEPQCLALAKKLTDKLEDWRTVYMSSNGYNSAAIEKEALQRVTRVLMNDMDGMSTDEDDDDPPRLRDDLPEGSEAAFTIEPIPNEVPYDELRIEFSSIKGYLYAGGAIGYNCINTKLNAKNIVNLSNVTAEGMVEEGGPDDAKKGKGEHDENAVTFSYAGGIIGRVTQFMRVENCSNDASIRVRGNGTYTGLLAEVNEGVITNCTTIGVSSSGSNALGGIAGLNRFIKYGDNTAYTSGYIVNCKLTGDLKGGKNVGGIAAVNSGLIENCEVGSASGVTIEGGGAVGAIAARNDGTIKSCKVIEDAAIIGENNVGGIAGENGGSIEACTIAEDTPIRGEENVGGFAGYQRVASSTNIVSGLKNEAAVSGSNYVGGIIGRIDGAVTVQECTNTKPISAAAANGYAGGILAYNGADGVIKDCQNTADVSAPQGNAGGIAAYNAGSVENCTASGTEAQPLNITAGKNAGGIAGIVGPEDKSGGRVSDCKLKNVKVTGVANADGANVGGVAGLNNGTVGPASAENLSVTGAASGGAIGGVAGKNRGSITGDDATRTSFNATVTLGSGLEGYTGGIAGWNLGTVQNYTFAGKVAAPGSALYGYGGVVGVNGDPNSAQMATIVNCSVNSAVKYKKDVTGKPALNDWDLEDVVGGNTEAGDAECTVVTTVKANVCVGGIAGLNCQYSTVSASTLESCYIRGYYGYVGGIVGLNKGDVTDCVAANATVEGKNAIQKNGNSANYGFNVKVYMYNGDVGGIVGRTTRTAVVKNCTTGHDWTVLVSNSRFGSSESTDNTCAGIIGYNTADKDITGLKNYARVNKSLGSSSNGGGIIGRQENVTSTSWRIAECINYGNVRAVARAGGIISHWKYNGGSVEDCENYGDINATSSFSGGIVADTLGASPNRRYNITRCFNNGNITGGGSVGGIMGCARTVNKNTVVTILDCENTGGAKNGGILGNRADSMTVNINRCINYNKDTKKSMVGDGAANVSNSICVPQTSDDAPIGGNGNKLNNFRLLHGDAGDSDTGAKLIKMGVIDNLDAATVSEYPYTAEGKAGDDKSYKITPGLKLDPNAGGNENKPYDNYLAINDQLKKFIEEQFKGDVKSPDTVTVTTSGGAYLANWTGSDNAYQYDVTVEIGSEVGGSFTLYPDASATMNYTVFENRLSFAVDSVFENKGLKLRVTVTAKNGSDEETSKSDLYPVLNPLLMPKVHYEMTYEDSKLQFCARLLNYDKYGDDIAVLQGITVESSFSVNGTEDKNTKKAFSVANRQSEPFGYTADKISNVSMSASASGNDYIMSPIFSMQTQLYGSDRMYGGNALSTMSAAPYLTGIRPSELACKLSLKASSDQVLRRTELVVTDIGLGRDVEVVIGESHNDRITATHALTLNLTAPLAGGQSYTVRSYPWGTQGVADGAEGYISGCAYGHAVAENVQRASLTTLVDPWDTNAVPTKIYVDTPGRESLADGYVLSLNADGTYDVYYSALLHCKQNSNNACQFITKDMKAPDAVAAPVLSDVPTTGNGYTVFTWTADGQTAADIYEAKVTAITFDDAEVTVVVPANAIQHTQDGGTLSLDLSAGNYRSVSVTITRLGTADASGKTTKLGSESNTVSYAIPRALPAIGSPTVSIDSSNGRADVKYVVSWTPETGYARDDTAGYTLWLEEDAAQGSPVALATPTTLTPDTDTTTVDLEAYQGKQVRLYLTAHCKPSPNNYTQDSPAGAPTIRTVASRVKLNDVTALALTPAYAAATSVSVDSFNADALLSTVSGLLVPPADAATASGSFVMQAAILKTDDKDSGGAPANMTDAKLIAWDANTVGMTSSVPNSLSVPSTYSLADFDDFSEDYAAMWVCARVRAVSSSNDLSQFVSSHWTPYAWLRLPRVQLNVPHSATSAAKLPEFSATTTNNDVLPIVEETAEQELSQAALEWTWDKHANACTITIEGDSGDGAAIYVILLERNEATGEFTATNKSGTAATLIAKDGASTALSPSFTWERSADANAPQYGCTLRYNDTTGRYLNVQTRLIVTTGEPDAEGNTVSTCKLVLPDYDQVTIGAITYDAPFCTKSVTLKYTPLEGDRYDESQELSWAWADTPNAETFAARGYVFGGIS